jgi:anion transporter
LKRDRIVKLIITGFTIIGFIVHSAYSQIQGQILGVVILALVIWSLYPKRHFESSILIIVLLSIFQASLSLDDFIDSLFSTYGGSGLWIIVSGFVLSKGMEVSGLGNRIALWIATSFGGKPENIILSVAIANFFLAPLSPSTTAKAFLIYPICIGLVDAFNVEKGKSNYGTALFLMAMAANNICSTAFLTATVPNPISAQYIAEATNIKISWIRWLIMALPLTVLLLGISWFILIRMFKPEVEKNAKSFEGIKRLRKNLGPLTRSERIVTIFFTFALFLWLTDEFHPYNSGLITLVLSLILFVPKLKIFIVGKFTGDIPWGSLALFAASMFLANAVGKWRAIDPVAKALFDSLRISSLAPFTFIVLVVLSTMLLHVVFTSTTVYATVILPLVISLAQLQNLNPQLVAIPVAFLAPIAVILPVNTIPNIVFHSSGYFNQKQMITYGFVLSLVSTFIVLFVGSIYWPMIGLF